ncbi:MAG: Gfo/Idh/MocA family oxidoreductase [Kiritimatiellae bacterium]|nr:Gfo/Idh/MocA family oxidoreductase [Kiritimatiellia bacterium]
MRSIVLSLSTVLLATTILIAGQPVSQIKVGIIGIDAHGVPWTKIINNAKPGSPISAIRVVATYPAYSPDIPFSNDNIQKNIETVRGLGVEIVDSIESLIAKSDAVIIATIEGRSHIKQAKPVFAARKPVVIDKPIASSLAGVVAIYREAQRTGTPLFSSSSLRYSQGIAAMSNDPKIGRVLGCDTYGNNVSILPGHPDLFYYGIHGSEMLFTIMGPGCRTVSRVHGDTADIVVGVWQDGRVGTFRGILQGRTGFGATVFGEKGVGPAGKFEGYEPLVVEISKFFQTRKTPLTAEQTLEIYTFMEAADESKRQGGRPVSMEEILKNAQREAEKISW